MPSGSFLEAFFFSIETLATVGYGHMYPATLYGHFAATVEIMVGMFGMAVVTGLIFIRFARPTARIEFSKTAVVSIFDGVPTLAIRVANLRHHPMIEAEFKMTVAYGKITAEGEVDYSKISNTEPATLPIPTIEEHTSSNAKN
jgi:inward rectifier potassium channel